MLTRRQFSRLLPAALLLPRLARGARVAGVDRKFLFLFCNGGWDTSLVFSPQHDIGADTDPADTLAAESGIVFVDSAFRPSVRDYFTRFGGRTCVINGMEVPSIVHRSCEQLLLTGRASDGADDWPAVLASSFDGVMPHLVLAGPSWSGQYTDRVVRVGSNGQLAALLDASALLDSDMPAAALSGDPASLVEDFVRSRSAAVARTAAAAERARLAAAWSAAHDNLAALRAQGSLDLTPQTDGCARDMEADFQTALSCFAMGLSRCAMLEYNGWCNQGWDTHQNQQLQSVSFEELFGHLITLQEYLETTPGQSGGMLVDEVVVVVLSEMGRHPRYNAWGGRDHWSTTSVMLSGAGVAGGQVIGQVNDSALGAPIDLASGWESDSGVVLSPGHLGATLLALADRDPGDVVGASDPITAALI